jgi:hypothetical protein
MYLTGNWKHNDKLAFERDGAARITCKPDLLSVLGNAASSVSADSNVE